MPLLAALCCGEPGEEQAEELAELLLPLGRQAVPERDRRGRQARGGTERVRLSDMGFLPKK